MAFTRTELRNIRDRAVQHANQVVREDALLGRALMELAHAANVLDAIQARSESAQRQQVRSPMPQPSYQQPTRQQPQEEEVVELDDEDEEDGEESVDPSEVGL